MLEDRPTVVDPELGECVVYAGSRLNAAIFAGLGLVLLLISGSASTTGYGMPTDTWNPAILIFCAAFWLVALWIVTMRLLVGERGFRYSRPFNSVEIPWSLVSRCRPEVWGSGRSRLAWVAVWLSGGEDGSDSTGTKMRLGLLFGFSAGNDEIAREMNAARRAALQSNVSERSETDDADGVQPIF
jgi:hypothetical protein